MSQKPNGNLYRLILGLPEDLTSPNHYELLGLDVRTSDAQVIRTAATDQNRKLLGWQNSDRYAEVRELTFEVIRARDVLLNDDSRAAYDRTLGDWGISQEGPWIVEEPAEEETSGPLSVECPDCRADFKLRNRDLIGRRIPCPECGFRFKVRPAQKAAVVEMAEALPESSSDAEPAELDEFGDFDEMADRSAAKRTERSRSRQEKKRDRFDLKPPVDDDEDYESRDRRRSRNRGRNRTKAAAPRPSRRIASRSSKPRSPGKKPRLSGKWAVLGGGVLMAVGLAVLASVLIQGTASPFASAPADRFAYLPADSESVHYCRLGELARSPLFQDYLTTNPPLRSAADRFRERMEMELEDVDSIAIAIKHDKSAAPNVGFSKGALFGVTFVAVVRSSQDWDRTKLIGPQTQSATHNDLTYHTFSPERHPPDTEWAFHLPDARTLVVGSLAEVQAAMDTGGNSPEWPETEFLQADYALVSARLPGSEPAGRPVPRNVRNNLVAKTMAHMSGSGFSLQGDTVEFATLTTWSSETEAAEYISEAEEHERQRQRRSPQFRRNGNPIVSRFVQRGRTVALIQDHDELPVSAGGSLHIPLHLLAALGNRSANAADDMNSQTDPAADAAPSNHPPPNDPTPDSATPNDLAPPPDADSLDALVADLQDRDKARLAALKLAKMEPVPERKKEVATHLENWARTALSRDKQYAVRALGVWGSSDNVPYLLSRLEEGNSNVHRATLAALRNIGDPQALPGVVASLKEKSLWPEAIKTLEHFRPQAESELLKTLATKTRPEITSFIGPEITLLEGICEALEKLGTGRSLPQLEALAGEHPAPFVKAAAKKAAEGILISQQSESELLKTLTTNGKDYQLQVTICKALEKVGTGSSLPHLEALIAGDHFQIVKNAAKSAADAIRERNP